MSFDALAWAAKQRPGNLAAKMVLLALANFSDENGCAYPSTAAIASFGDMDHKTATASLDRLVALNLIADTGEREGRTKQIKVYRLALESQPQTEAFQKRKAPEKVVKDPQKRVTDTIREPVSKEANASSDKRAIDRLRYHRLPEGWAPTRPLPPKLQAKVDLWPPGMLDDQLEALRRWAANAKDEPGKGRKLDWDIALHNWLDRHDADRPRKPNQPTIGRTMAAGANVLARYEATSRG
jgi:hypothetical protein